MIMQTPMMTTNHSLCSIAVKVCSLDQQPLSIKLSVQTRARTLQYADRHEALPNRNATVTLLQ